MNENKTFLEDLIAPCGMNCAICSRYLSYVNKLNKSNCIGCRKKESKCSYLFDKCKGINNNSKGKETYCFNCRLYPCKQIIRMDKRYRKYYKMSVIENLNCIKKGGIKMLIKQQYKKYNCSKCGGLLSIHNRKCFKCEKITKLIDKDENA
jgi:hypothetical protein